jgi:hypothetical protein
MVNILGFVSLFRMGHDVMNDEKSEAISTTILKEREKKTCKKQKAQHLISM